MKPLKLCLLLLTGFILQQNIPGQDLPFNDSVNKIEYLGINEYPNCSKSDLYYLAKEWLLINDFIVLMEDSASTRILAEKMFKSHYPGDNLLFSSDLSRDRGIRYNLILDFKNNRVRYNFTNFKILKFKDPYTYTIQGNNIPYVIKEDEGEIIISDAEDYYPIEKTESSQRKAYKYFFREIDDKVTTLQAGLKLYLGQREDW